MYRYVQLCADMRRYVQICTDIDYNAGAGRGFQKTGRK
jgi:hypothetical protein